MSAPDLTPGVPLLQTKLRIPPRRGDQVARPQLIEQLNAGFQQNRPLTLIAAAAGSGKTTLLSQWIPQSEKCVTWLSLDEEDNDFTRFWTYFIASLQLLQKNLAQDALQLLQAPQPPPAEAFLSILLNAVSQFDDRFILVLDDYHLIDTLSIHRSLAYLLDHIPPQMQLIISSRTDPPLPLARLRARGEMLELRAVDLAFDERETSDFFTDVMKLDISAETMTALEARTEGWAAGLQLAALALRGQADQERFLAEFTGGHRYILGFLLEEVFERQPEDIQHFLLKTAILERLSPSLCDAVTGEAGSQEMLESLYQENLFIAALDQQGQWYRYHHLFQDALRFRLKQAHGELVPVLHQRASRWYEEQRLLDQAVEHALAGQDLSRAGDLIVNAFLPLWKQSALGTLRRWIDELPEVAFEQHPDLAFASAILLGYTGQLAQAETRLALAETQGQAAPPPTHIAPDRATRHPGRIAMLKGILAARQGAVADALSLAEETFHLLPADDHVFRGGAFTVLGLAHLTSGALAEAQKAYEQAAEQARAVDHWFLLVGALGRLAPIQVALGRLHAAMASCQQMLDLPIVRRGGLPAAGFAHTGLAGVFYQWDRLDRADEHAATAVGQGEAAAIVDLVYTATLVQAQVKAAFGKRDDALALIGRAHEVAAQVGGPHMARRVRATGALIRLRFGEIEAAKHWERTLDSVEALDPLVVELEGLVQARLRLAEAQPEEALATLQSLLPAAETASRLSSVIEILLLQARALAASGQSGFAIERLERALTLSEPEGYVRIFVDEGSSLIDLLRAVGRRESASQLRPYLERLLASFGGTEERDAVPGELAHALIQPPIALLLEPLTEREQEVLRLVGEGFSNEEIANTLVISIHTVRKHISNVLAKLDVKSRTEAVACARRFGLL